VKGRGTARFRLLCLVPVLLVAKEIAGRPAHAGTESRVLAPGRIERDSRRFELLNTGALWEVLAIRPGMTVLDIGTGTGQFAYAFADRLHGRGKVYATDVNEGCVRYVQEQAEGRELRTVVPVLVKREGLDEFYRSDTYDLIAIFHVLMDFEKESDFLRYLGDSLADDGRLVLMLQKRFPDFSGHDFTDDHEGLVMEIMREHLDTPFYRAFRESTRTLMRASAGTGSAEGLFEAIAEDFNAILANANFGMDFFDGAAFRKDLDFTREERDYAQWLILPDNRQSVLRGVPNATWVSVQNARMINKLLIIQRFRKFLRSDTLFTSGLSPAGRDAFARAGYALHREYDDLIPFEDVLVYTHKHPGTDFKSVPR
jgi:SAM-dependent methyltransferase